MNNEKVTKAKEVFVRYGVQDIVVQYAPGLEDTLSDIDNYTLFLVGYEDEKGEECNEQGNYLKNIKINEQNKECPRRDIS